MVPIKIDRYDVKSEIGRGGMATVYEAYDPIFERTVAVKVLPREFMHDPEFRARFTREAKVIAKLEHPAIVPVYDFGHEGGQPFLVMRFMRGGSLADRLREGPLPIEETAVILQRLGSALDRAHSQGIIHRDLKPSNVLFDEYGDAYLADFGIVHLASSSEALTASGSLVGTPTYMSPEQVYGDKELDGRSDIYALGVILFQMLTGHTPYEADTPARLMMKHVMDPVPHIKESRPDLPDEFDEIINKAMAKERDERFTNASELSSALAAVTRRSDKDELAAKLAAVHTELQPEESAAQTTPAPEPEPEPEPEPKPAPGKPPEYFVDPTPPSSEAEKKRPQIPAWVWGIVGMVALLCVCAAVGAVLLSRSQLTLFAGDPTPTIVGLDVAGTQTAAANLPPTETAVPPTSTPLPGTLQAAATAAADAAATRDGLEATRTAVTDGTESDDDNGLVENLAEDLAATRASLEATRTTGDTPDVSPQLSANAGPFTGNLSHTLDGIIQSEYADVSMADFYTTVTFDNPYAIDVGGWDVGLTFRQVELNDELRLVIRSDGVWNLNNRQGDEDNFVQEGDVTALLDTSANGRNQIDLLALDETGYFFLNDTLVTALDLSSLTEAGDIAVGTGFYTSNMRAGEATAYSDFAAWELTPDYGPESGALEHIDDNFIKTAYANVLVTNFIAQATFTNPYGTETGSWDYGIAFRDESEGNLYWLTLTSDTEWILVNRVNGEDETVVEGTVDGMDLAADGQNQMTLIAENVRGYLFINSEFVTELDLSDRVAAGETAVFTAFFVGNEIEGNATAYDDFTIWQLP